MKTIRKSWCLLVCAVFVIFAQVASAKNLGVNLVLQRTTDPNGNRIGDNWCWACCSKMILNFYGYPKAVTEIVTYGLGSATYDTGNYIDSSGSESRANVLIWEEKPPGTFTRKKKTVNPLVWNGLGTVIRNFSNKEVQTQLFEEAISAAQITKEIDDNDAPFVRRIGWDGGGGHVTVCYGSNAGNLSIHDPWFGSLITSDALARRGRIRESAADAWSSYTWTRTLTTSKILDVVFLFDTTGSMGAYIANAKANASALLDKIAAKFKNYRVAVANYKDYPLSPYGDPGDYVFASNQVFTNDKATAQAGINSVPGAGGGNDVPESVYSALYNTLLGNGIGAWRENPCRRLIILIGDAPGHDPEPFPFGHSFGEILGIATDPDFPISVHCLWAGTSINAGNQFSLISGGTAGSVVNSASGGGTSAGLEAIVNSVAESPRFPKGNIGAIYPTYSFEPIGSGSMFADATGLVIELQKFDVKKSAWKRLRLITIKDPKATVYESTLPLPQAGYRWRLGFKRPASNVYLPSLDKDTPPTNPEQDAIGEKDSKRTTIAAKAVVTFEADYSEFTRVANLPARPTRLLPSSSSFTASDTKVEFQFGTVPGATSYVLEVLQNVVVKGVTVTKVFKHVALKPPTDDARVEALSKTLTGFKVGNTYTWRLQGLNYDRPKVDPAAW